MKLKLYNINNRYAFSVDKFSSMHHAFLVPELRQTYAFAWKAYKDAIKIARSYHPDVLKNKKYAAEDLTEPFVVDISAEEMLFDHYSEILNKIDDKAKGSNGPKEDKIVYEEIKAIVDELLKVKEKLEKDKDKAKIQDIIAKFAKIVSSKYGKFLKEDKIKEEKEAQNQPEIPQTPQMPQQAPQAPQAQEGEQPPPITANKIQRLFVKANFSDFTLDDKEEKEIMEEYGSRICEAIESLHPSAIYKVNGKNIDVIDSNNQKRILMAVVNKNINLEDVIPDGSIADIYPINSTEFYQKYWKPIIEKVGHFFIKDAEFIIATGNTALPDIPNKSPKAFRISVWDTKNKKENSVNLKFSGEEKPYWSFEKENLNLAKVAKKSNVEYTEDDFITGSPRRVMCIVAELKSIYQKIGEIVQVIPLDTHIELDINFGNQVIRLTHKQIEIVT
jgi:hypothetical protein